MMRWLPAHLPLKRTIPLLLAAAFVLAAIACVVLVNRRDRRHALDEAHGQAAILLGQNQALLAHFRDRIRPKTLALQGKISPDAFDPLLSSSFFTLRQVNEDYNAKSPSPYRSKVCALNARMPQNEADPDEAAVIREFDANRAVAEHAVLREISGEPYLVLMRPGLAVGAACRRCHSTPDAAPGELVARYGRERGFGWPEGRIVWVHSVRVPLAAAFRAADEFSLKLSLGFAAALLCLYLFSAGLVDMLVLRPLHRLREAAGRLAASPDALEKTAPPRGRELADLAAALDGMSRSLSAERGLLAARVAERTAALVESEERFRVLFEDAPLPYQSLDADGRFLDVNRTWCAALGYAREDILGRKFRECIAPAEREAFDARFTEFKRRGMGEGVEIRLVRKDGTTLVASITGRVQRDAAGNFLRTHCIFTDVTERRHSEELLRKDAERWAALLHLYTTPRPPASPTRTSIPLSWTRRWRSPRARSGSSTSWPRTSGPWRSRPGTRPRARAALPPTRPTTPSSAPATGSTASGSSSRWCTTTSRTPPTRRACPRGISRCAAS
jgi:PAS domain S-box-containing protein